MTLRGLTWDHPRAYRPLQAFAAHCPDIAVSWDRQSLADFEARPIATLAQSYDLMIIDHPGLGAAIAAHALQPLDQLVPAGQLAAWQAGSVGPTWASYTISGQQWAIPIDAATQVSVFRPGRLDGVPRGWAEVPALARRHRTALCLGGPHAFLTLLAMCASARSGAPAGPELLRPRDAAAALGILRAVWAAADQELSQADPIVVHEALAAGTVAYCPLAYGYASYARPAAGRHALAWADAPTFGSARPGSVLGGTGLAVSAPRRPDPAGIARLPDRVPGPRRAGRPGPGARRPAGPGRGLGQRGGRPGLGRVLPRRPALPGRGLGPAAR